MSHWIDWGGRDEPPADPEGPESCPICGAQNSDDEGNWTCPEAPGFCSTAHEQQYLAAEAEAEAHLEKELKELDLELDRMERE